MDKTLIQLWLVQFNWLYPKTWPSYKLDSQPQVDICCVLCYATLWHVLQMTVVVNDLAAKHSKGLGLM